MKKTKSIFFRNFITTLVVLLVCFAILGSSVVVVSYKHSIDQKTEEMVSNAHRAARIVSAYGSQWELDGLEVRAVISWIAEITGVHLLVCDGRGNVVSCSDREVNCPHIGRHVSENVTAQIDIEGVYAGGPMMKDIVGAREHVVGAALGPDGADGDSMGYIFMSATTNDFSALWRDFAGIHILVLIIVLVFAVIITYVTTLRQTRPIKKITAAAQRFSYGDFSVRVDGGVDTNEITELADSFNVMADSIERSEQAWRDLIANVAHELKTPMTTITGFADGILDGTIPEEKQREYVQIISSETKRLNRLVRGMLEMSRVQDSNSAEVLNKSFDITEVIRIAILSLEKKITDKGLDVDVQLPEEAVVVRGDGDSMTQVVYNLIDNAAKFADTGTEIRITVWKKEMKVFVSVENQGNTISKEDLPRIFDRFHKADKSRSMDRDGVGLGLYIVKTIINRHKEDIYVSSDNGVTRFIFTLTLKDPKSHEPNLQK